MVATALVFALGALVASLVALLLVPLLWRKAQRLARRDFDATIPASVKEIRGEIDAVRATAAFEMRRTEIRAAEARETGVRERAEAGRVLVENGDLRTRQSELEAELTRRDQAIAHLEERLTALAGERDELHETRQELRDKLQVRARELDLLAAEFQALREVADEQRSALAAAETRILHLSDAKRSAAKTPEPAPSPSLSTPSAAPIGVPAIAASTADGETSGRALDASDASPSSVALSAPVPVPALSQRETREAGPSGSNRLRAAIAARAGARREPTREENAEIRERITDIAARILHKEVQTQGPQSPVAQLLAEDEATTASAGGASTLAARVRQLMATEGEGSPVPIIDETRGAGAGSLAAEVNPATTAKRNGGGRSRPKSRR
ncbi:hypothetical protein [Aureimonas pseudogalii]|uniref:Uncharacterized protein n=1 Tax=Aureimonas pseudogalii TaxID=1744844 RepID=A0A7W6MKG4_9HYPH|nr:hypothetical protein [Aureimonas pseudogalii]MBB3998970.1 hypothetical protein [Aureimonas pseudogalii]